MAYMPKLDHDVKRSYRNSVFGADIGAWLVSIFFEAAPKGCPVKTVVNLVKLQRNAKDDLHTDQGG